MTYLNGSNPTRLFVACAISRQREAESRQGINPSARKAQLNEAYALYQEIGGQRFLGRLIVAKLDRQDRQGTIPTFVRNCGKFRVNFAGTRQHSLLTIAEVQEYFGE